MDVDGCDNVTIVTRQDWGARQTKDSHHMNTPVTALFIHHTAMKPCMTLQDCSAEMRTIQDFHMDDRGMYIPSVGYFVVFTRRLGGNCKRYCSRRTQIKPFKRFRLQIT